MLVPSEYLRHAICKITIYQFMALILVDRLQPSPPTARKKYDPGCFLQLFQMWKICAKIVSKKTKTYRLLLSVFRGIQYLAKKSLAPFLQLCL